MKTFIYILILTGISFFSYATGEDSTKTKYDINDSRNPDCPCHKYQKLADEEYQRQVANDHINKVAKEVSEKIVAIHNNEMDLGFADASPHLTNKPEAKSGSELKKTKIKRSVFSKRSGLQHKKNTPKKRKIRFGKKDNSKCTHW